MKKPVYAAGARVRLSPLQRIIEKTGRRPTECKCHLCKRQCHTPCLGTPQDILRLIDAGYADRLAPTVWEAGVLMGVVAQPVPLIQAKTMPTWWPRWSGGIKKKQRIKRIEQIMIIGNIYDHPEMIDKKGWNESAQSVAHQKKCPVSFLGNSNFTDRKKKGGDDDLEP